jgi:hypothetical protein
VCISRVGKQVVRTVSRSCVHFFFSLLRRFCGYSKEPVVSRRQLRSVAFSFAFAKLLHQGEDRKLSVVREVFLRNVVRLRSVAERSLEF